MYIAIALIIFIPTVIFFGFAIEEYLEVSQLVSKGTRTMAEVTNVEKVIIKEDLSSYGWGEVILLCMNISYNTVTITIN